jgi:hypothetical protein
MNTAKIPAYIAGGIVLIILALAFYWFEWRISEIRKDCSKKVSDVLANASNPQKDDYTFYYKICLEKHGL